MAHFSFVIFHTGDLAEEELSGEYADARQASCEAKRFLFDVGEELLTRGTGGTLRVQVRESSGLPIFEASVDYCVNLDRRHAATGSTALR